MLTHINVTLRDAANWDAAAAFDWTTAGPVTPATYSMVFF
jgi:hypothetical protein